MSHIRSRKHKPARIAAMVAATFSIATNMSAVSAAEEVAELPEVSVKSQKEVPFKADESASPKFTKPLIDTTQTVQVIKQELLREQGAFSLTDALRNTPGITIQMGENGNSAAGDTFSMRGFATQNSLFVDGIRDLGAVTRDVFNLEQIEVIKGPAGADIGRGAASGYINLISKLPSLNDRNMATVSYGTADKKRATIDMNKAISETTAVRFNALGFDGNVDKRDEVDNQNFSIAPSIAFGLGTDSRLYLFSQHIRQDNTPDGGIPTIGFSGYFNADANLNNGRKVDRENFYGSDNDYEKVDADMITAKFEYDLTPDITLRNITRYGKTTLDRVVTGVNTGGAGLNAPTADPATWTANRNRQRLDREDEIIINQTSFNGVFDLGGFKNSFVAGLELMRESQQNKDDNPAASGTPGNPLANLYNPNENDFLPKPGFNGVVTDGETTTTAVYVFDTIDLTDKWQVNAGLRQEHYKTQTDVSGPAPRKAKDSGNLLSWKTGVLFKPAVNGSIYASYATSYTPPGSANFALSATANNINNDESDPQKTKNIEVGTKWDLLNEQLNVTAAVFSTENSKQASFNDLGQAEQTGKTRINGIELLAIGQLTRNWQLSAGVTRLDAKALDQQNAAGVVTNGVRFTPDYSATVWSQYQLGKFSVGAGGRYFSTQKRVVTESTAPSTGLSEIPSYFAADAMVAYAVNPNLNLRLNVYNIFDKEYIETLNNGGGRVRLGQPRSAYLTAEFMF